MFTNAENFTKIVQAIPPGANLWAKFQILVMGLQSHTSAPMNLKSGVEELTAHHTNFTLNSTCGAKTTE